MELEGVVAKPAELVEATLVQGEEGETRVGKIERLVASFSFCGAGGSRTLVQTSN